MDRSRVAIVIPALNEAETIGKIVSDALKHGIVIVVDDGSSDKTFQFAEFAGAYVCRHEKNLGYDAALNSGFIKAANLGCTVILTLDADGQHNPSVVQEFLKEIERGSWVVVGARNKKSRLSEYLFGFYTARRFGVHDPLCGMKAYKLNLYLERGYFDSYNSVGTELLIYAANRRYPISEIAIDVGERVGSSRFGQTILGNFKIIRSLFKSFQIKI